MRFRSGGRFKCTVAGSLSQLAGVFFLQIGSSALTSCIVAMTGLSLTLAIAILVDVSLPWRGFITVDTGIFVSIRKDISLVLDNEQEQVQAQSPGGTELTCDDADVRAHHHSRLLLLLHGLTELCDGAIMVQCGCCGAERSVR